MGVVQHCVRLNLGLVLCGDIHEDEILGLSSCRCRSICRHFLEGKCNYGDKCRFGHDVHELLAPVPETVPQGRQGQQSDWLSDTFEVDRNVPAAVYKPLVGGLEHFIFFYLFGIIIQIDFHIFQRG